jgi:hypothetical protein
LIGEIDIIKPLKVGLEIASRTQALTSNWFPVSLGPKRGRKKERQILPEFARMCIIFASVYL